MPTSRLARLTALGLLTLAFSSPAFAQPGFSKVFQPSSIAAGGHSQLVFTITNGAASPAVDLAFTDTFPAAITIATPASASTDCGLAATLTAPDGGGTISLAGGTLPAFGTCTVVVDVVSSTAGVHTNLSGDLTSSLGNSGTATDDLEVVTNRAVFTKSFATSPISLGDRSTLTFSFDNSANAGFAFSGNFNDRLPTGLVVADPANLSTDCLGAAFTAVAGTDEIFAFTINLSGNQACTASVDVRGEALGSFSNRSGEFFATPGGPLVSSGFAVAGLDVVESGPLIARKSFTNDPVNPGNTVELEFTVQNLDRFSAATDLTFTDDLDAVLSGLVATGLPASDVCGAGSTLSGSSVLSLTGGNLPAGGACTFSVTLAVPMGATAGAYPNVTSAMSAMIGGSPAAGDPASETLFVNDAPAVTKTFLTNPVGAGDTVQLEFTVTNTSATSTATNISLQDNLSAFLSGAQLTSAPTAPCGAGSLIFPQVISGDDFLVLSSGNLATSASCTFTVDLQIPSGVPAGDYLNVTDAISATVDGVTQTGGTASDTLTIVGAPRLAKDFTDDPVAPGGTVTLEFTLEHSAAASADATNIGFTDDLNAVIAGLAATGLPLTDVCGVGSSISGTTSLTFSGGTLSPGGSCTFSVPVLVPGGAFPGTYTNVTSDLTATVGGVSTTANGASAPLEVSGLEFTKEFIDNPMLPGSAGTLRFTVNNTSAIDVSGGVFTDTLSATLTGLTAVAPLPTDPCGAGSTLSGTTFLVGINLNLTAGTSCTFDVPIQLPGGVANGSYPNTTSDLVFTTPAFSVGAATDVLVIDDEILETSKTFTNNPVAAGGTAFLEITVLNTSTTETVTSLTLTDNLEAMLTGATALGLPLSDVCGAGSDLSGAGLVTLTGGTLAPTASCTFTFAVQIPASALDGTYSNVTSQPTGLASAGGVSGSAGTADLQVRSLTFSKAFQSSPEPGQTVDLRFEIENPGAAPVGQLAFSDDLSAVIPGLVATGLPQNDICGSGSSISGTGTLLFTAGTLGGTETCTFTVTLQVPLTATVGSFPNTTTDLTSAGLTVANPATDSLTITAPATVDATLAKAFQSTPVLRDQSVVLQYTITNSSPLPISDVGFTDDFNAALTGLVATGLPASNVCGAGSTLTGTGTVALAGGSLAPGAMCQFSVTLDLPATAAVGTVTSTSGNLNFNAAGAPFSNAAAADTFDVALLGFAKAFQATGVLPGATVDLTYTVTNPDPANAVSGVTFTDDFGAVITGLATSALPATGFCGAGSTATGTGVLTAANLTVPASGSCVFTVTLQVPVDAVEGTFPSTASVLTSGATVLSLTAADNLVIAAPTTVDATLAKAFQASPVVPGQSIDVQYTVTNSSVFPISNVAFSDDLDAALTGLVATGLPQSNVCGTGSTLSGTSTVSLAAGTLAPGASCQFTVTLDVPTTATAGTVTSTTGTLDFTAAGSSFSNAAAADTFDVALLTFTKAFQSNPVPGDTVDLLFTITNPDPANAIAALTFTDDLDATLTGLVATGLPATDPCGVGSTVSGTSTISLAGGAVPAGGSCSFTVTLQVPVKAAVGTYPNTTGDLLSSGNVVGAPATDDLEVLAPGSIDATLAKAFQSTPVVPGQSVDVQYTINNASAVTLMSVAFSDDLDSALTGLVATGLPQSDVCGAGSTVSGTSTLALAGGTLAPGAMCQFTVTLSVPTGAAAGTVTGTTGTLDFTANGVAFSNAAATDTFDVALMGFTKTFLADPVAPGDSVDLQFTITNPDPVNAIPSLSFTDDLDAVITGLAATGLPQSDVCGAGSTISGTSTLALADGSVAAGGSCTFTVTLQVPTAAVVGAFPNATGDLLSSGSIVGAPATDDLDISAPTSVDASVTKAFVSSPVVRDQSVAVTYTVTNSSPFAISDIGLTDDYDSALAGLVATDLPQADICGAGSSLTGTDTMTLAGGSLAPGAFCSFTVTLDLPPTAAVGPVTGATGTLDFTAAGAPYSNAGAVASFDVALLDFSKAFVGDPAEPAETVDVTFTITNPDPANAISGLTFQDDFDAALAGLSVVTLPADGFCGAGSTATGAGLLTVAGAEVPAGGVCTVTVTAQVPANAVAGTYTNTTTELTAGGVTLGLPAADDLIVEAPSTVDVTIEKSFLTSPVLPGGDVVLSYTITNASPVAITDLAFDDNLDAALTGLAATGLPLADVCGAGSTLSGTGTVSLTGGGLGRSGSCTFDVTLTVPPTAPLGPVTSTTDALTYSAGGAPFTGGTATGSFDVAFLGFAKVFDTSPVVPGETIGLTFMVDNPDPANAAAGLAFTDDLEAVLPGLVAVGTPLADVCGAGSTVTGTSIIALADGSLGAGGSCTFTVDVLVPPANDGVVVNITSALTAEVGGSAVVGDPADAATADLTIANLVTEIPTASAWGLLALAALLTMLAIRRLRLG